MTQPTGVSDVTEGLTKVGYAAAGLTDPGLVRERNEDSFHVSEEAGLAVVSDGMGGAPAGEVASALAVDCVTSRLVQFAGAVWDDPDAQAPRDAVESAILAAHQAILDDGAEKLERAGMGATVTVLLAHRETGRFVIGHVGDSRAYLLRRGVLRQLTRDDTLLQDQVEQGRVPAELARQHPFGHILSQVLGMEHELSPQIVEGSFELGDQVFLCSDGVTAVLEDREIGEMLTRGRLWPPSTVLRAFIESVNERGGPDNATGILMRRI